MQRDGKTGSRTTLDARLAWRPEGHRDVPEWADLIARTAAVERPVRFERHAELEQILASKNNPAKENTVLGFDSEGIARAYARITKNRDGGKAVGFGCVDPQWQGSGVGTGLLRWTEQRTRERFAEDAACGAVSAVQAARRFQPRCRSYGFTWSSNTNTRRRSLSAPATQWSATSMRCTGL